MKHRMTEGMAVAIIGPMIGEGGVLTRYFTRLDPLLTQYYTIPTWTASGDFEIEFDCTIPTVGCYFLAEKTSTSAVQRFGISASGRFFGLADTASLYGSVFTPNSKLNHVIVRRESGVLTVDVDGVTYATQSSASTIMLDSFATPYAGSTTVPYLTGYIANVSLQTAGDNRLYKLDENFGETSVVKNSLATLGSELASNIFIDIDTVNGFENFGVTNISAALVYLCEMEVESVTAGTIRLNTNGNTSSNISEPDTVSLTASGSTFARLQSGAGGFTGRVKLSVKQADGYGTAKNLAESTDFVFDGAVSPNTWTDIPTGLIVLEVAGT